MSKKVASWVGACIPPVGRLMDNENDELLWSRDIGKHSHGEFSLAVVQGNEVMEDKSQVEPGQNATFVGIYDGHGGSSAATYVCDKLFDNLLDLGKELQTMSEDMIKSAFALTEEGFQAIVANEFNERPNIATVGSCCLVGVIRGMRLHIANLGDSRAVLGYLNNSNEMVNEQLTQDHNVSNIDVRNELAAAYEDDEQVVVYGNGMYRIKGVMQISRAIGDAFLKIPEYGNDARFNLQPPPLTRPVIRADPDTSTLHLEERHKFVIFASDGLWELLENQEAVDIVAKGPQAGIAKRLIKTALKKAAGRRNTSYKKMKKFDPNKRRDYHDDISVLVLFIDLNNNNNASQDPRFSVHSFRNDDAEARFDF